MSFNHVEKLLRGHIPGDDFTPGAKPPLGLRPRYCVNPLELPTERAAEIREAITRYEAAGKEVPGDWRAELAALFLAGA